MRSDAIASEGLRLGRYELKRPLGEGGNGQVFLAWQENAAGEPLVCVVKFPLQRFATKSDACERFMSEARLAMRLGSHPNIVQVIDVGTHLELPFIVMEYVDGTDLRRLLNRLRRMNRALSLAAIYNILASATSALHHAHVGATVARTPVGVIHRDVKPANVLVTRDGMTKLADFGIGTTIEEGTSGNFIRGTYRYMSPEHVRCEVRPEMDIYALGVVAWEMLENRPYRDGHEETQHLAAIVQGHVPRMENPYAPPRLVKLVEACLEHNPRHRPSARELLRALEQCPGYSRDPSELQRIISATLGPHRSSGKTHQELAITPELIATFAALTLNKLPSAGPPGPADPRCAPAWPGAAEKMVRELGLPSHGYVEYDADGVPSHTPTLHEPTPHPSQSTTRTAWGSRPLRRVPMVLGGIALATLSALTVIAVARWDALGLAPSAEALSQPVSDATSERAAVDAEIPGTVTDVSVLAPAGVEPGAKDRAHEPTPVPPDERASTPVAAQRQQPAGEQPQQLATEQRQPRALEPPQQPAVEQAPAVEQQSVSKRDTRSRAQTQRALSPTVPVKLVLFLLDEAQVQLGRKTVPVGPGTEVQVTTGRHRLRWRATPGEPWREAGRKTFRAGKLYMIRFHANGTEEFVELDASKGGGA